MPLDELFNEHLFKCHTRKRIKVTFDVLLDVRVITDLRGGLMPVTQPLCTKGHLEKFKVSLQNKEAPLCPCG